MVPVRLAEEETCLPRVHRTFSRQTKSTNVHAQRNFGLFRENSELRGVACHKVLHEF
jgi:hypothetical protein